jgi:glycerol-3-phosphate dehydrogenase
VSAGVAIIGGGVVGAAVAHALARRGVGATLLEAQDDLALGASGANSGILHTGFDAVPGELETALIRRSAALRDRALAREAVPVLRCGALLRPRSADEARAVAALAERARVNGVQARLRDDGALEVPGEAVTDPVAFTRALASAAAAGGADVRTGERVLAIGRRRGRLRLALAGGGEVTCAVAVNCAGLHADDVARLAGDDSLEIYARKGEFLVFDPPDGVALEHILLPVPTERTKGVLVFPTVDGRVVAGPTAHDQHDKLDRSVRVQAREQLLAGARAILPALEAAEPIAGYAGLRPAGRGMNYAIGASAACPGLLNVAAIRSTGLSASLGIGEHVVGLVAQQGIVLGPERDLPRRPAPAPPSDGAWWRRAARHATAVAT